MDLGSQFLAWKFLYTIPLCPLKIESYIKKSGIYKDFSLGAITVQTTPPITPSTPARLTLEIASRVA